VLEGRGPCVALRKWGGRHAEKDAGGGHDGREGVLAVVERFLRIRRTRYYLHIGVNTKTKQNLQIKRGYSS
jgi:hypothetical protein